MGVGFSPEVRETRVKEVRMALIGRMMKEPVAFGRQRCTHQIGPSDSLRGRIGPYPNSDHAHGTLRGLNDGQRTNGGVASGRQCLNVSNYCVRPAIDNTYGLRAVTLG